MKHIVIELPQFLNKVSHESMGHPLEDVDLHCLKKMLSRCNSIKNTETQSKPMFKFVEKGSFNPRWAAKMHQLSGAEQEGYFWFRADPMELQPDRIAVYLNGNLHLDLDDKEKKILEDTINSISGDEEYQYFCISSAEGYIRVKKHEHVKFTPLYEAIGRDQIQTFPSGVDALFWKKLLTEIQMQLHGSSINTQHIRKGSGLINSLYFWGNCHTQTPLIHADHIYSNSHIIQSIAEENSIEFDPIPNKWDPENLTKGTHHIVDTELLWLVKQGLFSKWLEKICHYEKYLIKPMIKSLKKKKIDSITLISDSDNQFHFTYKHALRFWRMTKNISEFID